jgi:hypothetical protein
MQRRVSRVRHGLIRRLGRRTGLLGQPPHAWDAVADELEPVVRRGGYDVVIGRAQDLSYVLTRPLGSVGKVVDLANIWFLEGYYQWTPDYREVEATFLREASLLSTADLVVLPSRHLVEVVREAFPQLDTLKDKLLIASLGCGTPNVRARWAPSPRVVYAGSYYYLQDPYLLSRLAGEAPDRIDCYGSVDPNQAFLPTRLTYRGFAPSEDFLAGYQFGLICIARDRLRAKSPATKLPYYLSYGLPVLFPEWMEEGYDFGDCAVPFAEGRFLQSILDAAEPGRWSGLSEAAVTRARALTWEATLRPLVTALEERFGGPR